MYLSAYAAFEIAAVIVPSVYAVVREGLTSSRELLSAARLFLMLSAPIAWLPLSVEVCLAFKGRTRPIVACLTAGAVAGVVLATLLAIASTWLRTVSFDTSNPLDESFSWLELAWRLAENLAIGVPSGGLGGFAFWAVCFWRPSEVGPATPKVENC